MRRNLLLLSVITLAMMSCAKTDVDDVGAGNGGSGDVGTEENINEVAVEVIAPTIGASTTSRAAIDCSGDSGEIDLSWIAGDQIDAWYSEEWDNISSKFTIDESTIEDDGASAIFNGVLPREKCRLIYPADVIGSGPVKGALVDLNHQEIDMSDSGLKAMSKYVVMVSPEIDSSLTPLSTSMEFLGAAVKLDLRFEGLKDGVEYTISSVCFGEDISVSRAVIDYSLDADDPEILHSVSDEGVETTIYNSPKVVNYSADNAESEYTLFLGILPTSVSAGNAINLAVELKGSDMMLYYAAFEVTYEATVEFASGTFSSVDFVCDMTDASSKEYFFEESGLAEDPYLIENVDDFMLLYNTLEDENFHEKHFLLTTDIDLEASAENPMECMDDAEFGGIFDGGGHTISGVYINGEEYVSLFGELEEAVIANLTIEGDIISSDSFAGAFAYFGEDVTFINCHNRANVTGTDRVAGIVGGGSGIKLVNCSNSGTITGDEFDEDDDASNVVMRVAGLAGGCKDAILLNCYNAGDVINLSADAPNGAGYALVAPGWERECLPVVARSYYSSDKKGVDPYGTAISKSDSYITSAAFVSKLNENVGLCNHTALAESRIKACEWMLGSDNYPVTNTTVVQPSQSMKLKGSGIQVDPYTISTKEDLMLMRDIINMSGSDAWASSYYKVTADIDLEGSAENKWTPIGGRVDFEGVFDGGGHTISGLYVDTCSDYSGLFGYADCATFANVTIDGVINSSSDFCGGVVGASQDSYFIGCHNRADVTALSRVGGIAGGGGRGTFINCSNSGIIVGDDSNSTSRIGGIAGTLGDGTIANCYNVGSVTNLVDGYDAYAIASDGGGSTPDSANCFYKDGCGDDFYFIATLVTDEYLKSAEMIDLFNKYSAGYNYLCDNADIQLCEWVATAEGYPTTNSTIVTAQAVGDFEGSGSESDPYLISSAEDLYDMATIVNNFNDEFGESFYELTANIDLKGSEDNQWTPIGNSASFDGVFNGAGHTISGLYINNDLYGQALFGATEYASIYDLTVEGSVTTTASIGYSAAAGLVGYAYCSRILRCHNKVDVTGTDCVGGLVGSDRVSYIINSINSGAIVGADADGRVGGIVGESDESVIMANYNVGSVSNSAGDAYAVTASALPSYGFASTVAFCFCLEDSGLDLNATSLIESYMTSDAFVEDMDKASGRYNLQYHDSNEPRAMLWESGADGYPTVTQTIAPEEELTLDFDGEGTEQSPYLITSSYGFDYLAMYTSLTEDDLKGKYFKLTDDIYGIGSPIENPTFATFDGDNHIITLASVESALFVNNYGVVKNFRVKVDKDLIDYGSVDFSSLLVANNFGTVENCHLEGSLSLKSSNSGALAGLVAVNHGVVNGCSNSADLTIDARTLGGIVGKNDDGGVVVNCYNTGDIVSTCMFGNTIGGIVAKCENSSESYVLIANCYNLGRIAMTSEDGGDDGIGGVVGWFTYSSDNMFTSYNVGSIECADPSYNRFGSLIGYCISTSFIDDSCYYLEGSVKLTNDKEGHIRGVAVETLEGLNSAEVVDALNAKVDELNNSVDMRVTLYKWKVGATSPEFDIE